MKKLNHITTLFVILLMCNVSLLKSQVDPFAVKATDKPLVIVSGIPNGSYNQIVNDFVEGAKDAIEIRTSQGSVDNYNKLNNDPDVDIVFLQYDVLQKAKLYDYKTKQHTIENIKVLLPLANEEIHLITKSTNNINSLQDLKNKKVGVGVPSKEGTNITSGLIKSITEIRWIDIEIPFDDAFAALLTDSIDAMFFVGYAPVAKLRDLLPSFGKVIKLVPITEDRLGKFHFKSTIKAGTYSWLNYDVETYAVKSLLAVNVKKQTASDLEKFENLIRYIKDNLSRLQNEGHPKWKEVDFDFSGIKWDIHPVAKKVFGL